MTSLLWLIILIGITITLFIFALCKTNTSDTLSKTQPSPTIPKKLLRLHAKLSHMLPKLHLTAKTGEQYRIIVSDGIQQCAIIILDNTQQQRHMGDMLIIHTDGTTAHLTQIAKSLRHHIHSSVH